MRDDYYELPPEDDFGPPPARPMSPVPPAQPSVPPGWYPDPNAPSLMRWWDGNTWTYYSSPAAGAPKTAAQVRSGARPFTFFQVAAFAGCIMGGFFVLAIVVGVFSFLSDPHAKMFSNK